MKGHELLAKALVDHGVDTTFGVIGDANLFFVDSLVRQQGVTHVSATHEGAATAMADGYARASGKLGVATVTHGPGLTNTLTALTSAARNDTPMLLMCGDTGPTGGSPFQDIPQREIITPTGAGFEQIRSLKTAAADIANAVRRAFDERRAIAVNMPIDFMWQDAEYERVVFERGERQAIAPDPSALDRAVGVIATARRPIIVAGRGAVRAGARDALLRLADRIGAPVATTLFAKDYFRGDPFDLGIFGTLSTAVAADAIAHADCIITFGASLHSFTTVSETILQGKRVVQCDLDPRRLREPARIAAGVAGDAAAVADLFVSWLDEAEVPPSEFRSPELSRALAEYRAEDDFVDQSTEDTVDVSTFTLRMDEILPERTMVTDIGLFMQQPMKYLHVTDPAAYLSTFSFGSVGLGMATAIGAGVGRPEQPVVAALGDGGFMMGGLAEFNTAVRFGVDLIAIVYNDGGYGAEAIQFRKRDMDGSIGYLEWPELAPVADALGGTGVTVRNLADIDVAAEVIKNRDRPVLVEVKVDTERVPDIHR